MSHEGDLVCIACSVFRDELEALRDAGRFDLPVLYLDSLLHADGKALRRAIEKLLGPERKRGRKVLLLYGDCHPYIDEHEAESGVARVEAMNCCDALLGREGYRTLRREGVFFLMPEWGARWQEVIQTQIGMNRTNTRSFMTDMHTKLLYLDTGLVSVPAESLDEASDFTGLPWGSIGVSHDHLLAAIEEAKERVDAK